MAMKFVVCVNKEGLGDLSGEDLTIGHVYESIGDADQHGMIRISTGKRRVVTFRAGLLMKNRCNA